MGAVVGSPAVGAHSWSLSAQPSNTWRGISKIRLFFVVLIYDSLKGILEFLEYLNGMSDW